MKHEERFGLANGSVTKCRLGCALLLVNGRPTVDEVIFGSDIADPLLGATTLERLGLAVDPVNQKLFRPRNGIIQCSGLSR